MNIYAYIKESDDNTIQHQENIIHSYDKENSIEISNIYINRKNNSHARIENYLDYIIDKLSSGDRLIVAELKFLGKSIFHILRIIEKANLRNISIFSVHEKLFFSHENKLLLSLTTTLLDIQESLTNKRLNTSKKTRLKNKTKLGRKSGKKTKSIFDKHKIKIMKLYNQSIPKTKILIEIKKDDLQLENTSPQALGQYIKKLEHIQHSKRITKLLKKSGY